MNVIFDMDGVIFDTERVFLECCVPVAERLGLADIKEAVCECVGMTDEETKRKLRARYGADAPLEEFDREVVKAFMERFEKNLIPVKEGVVALLEDSATIKTFYKFKDHIELKPENDSMDPIIVNGNIQILGKVFGVFRLCK